MAVTAQRRRRGLIAVVAAVLAVGMFLLAITLAKGGDAGGPQGPVQAPEAMKSVVVASTDIKAGDPLSSSNLAVADYPQTVLDGIAPVGGSAPYFTSTTALLESKHFAAISLPKGALLLSAEVTAPGATGPNAPLVKSLLQPGDVAISVPYNSADGAGGYFNAGDHIDIVIKDANGPEHYAFQNVYILEVGLAPTPTTPGSGGGAAAPATSTASAGLLLLELTREKAAALAFAIDSGWKIRYVIRPASEQGAAAGGPSSPVGADNYASFTDG